MSDTQALAHAQLDKLFELKAKTDSWQARYDAFECFRQLATLTVRDLIGERLANAALGRPLDRDEGSTVPAGDIAYLQNWQSGGSRSEGARPEDVEALRMMLARLVLDFGHLLPANAATTFAQAMQALNQGHREHPLLKPSGVKRYADGGTSDVYRVLKMRQANYRAGYTGQSLGDAWGSLGFEEGRKGLDAAQRYYRRKGIADFHRKLFAKDFERGKADKASGRPENPPASYYDPMTRDWKSDAESYTERVLKSLRNFYSPREAPPGVVNALRSALQPLAKGPDKNRA